MPPKLWMALAIYAVLAALSVLLLSGKLLIALLGLLAGLALKTLIAHYGRL